MRYLASTRQAGVFHRTRIDSVNSIHKRFDSLEVNFFSQAIMQAVDTTAEGLSKLEGGGVDTRGRNFADVLEQLSFAVSGIQPS